jgi:hypothetical protein
MKNSSWKVVLIFIIAMTSVHADDLFVEQIELPTDLQENILSLSKEIKYSWPKATYHRETIDFGIVFPTLEEGRMIERPMPPFIIEIRNLVFELFRSRLEEGASAEDFNNCIITIYQTGDGIAPHIDRNLEWATQNEARKYYFGASVMGLIVEPDTQQSLYFENPQIGKESRFYLQEKPGTAFLFQGLLRNEWKHGLHPIEQRRISLTFRKVNELL